MTYLFQLSVTKYPRHKTDHTCSNLPHTHRVPGKGFSTCSTDPWNLKFCKIIWSPSEKCMVLKLWTQKSVARTVSLSSSLKLLHPGGRHNGAGSEIKEVQPAKSHLWRWYAETREPCIHIPTGLHKRFIIFYNKDVWPLVSDSMPQQ